MHMHRSRGRVPPAEIRPGDLPLPLHLQPSASPSRPLPTTFPSNTPSPSPSTPPTPEINLAIYSPLLLTSGGHRWRLSSHLVLISNGGHPSLPPSPIPPTPPSPTHFPLSTPPTQDMRPGDLFPPLLLTSGGHRWRLSPSWY